MNDLALRLHTVRVHCLVADGERDPDDTYVPEVWEVLLPEQSRAWTPGQCATYVLDQFHASVPIAMLEDFSIHVFDAKGNEITEDMPANEASGLSTKGFSM